jgi:hypothetical protein
MIWYHPLGVFYSEDFSASRSQEMWNVYDES